MSSVVRSTAKRIAQKLLGHSDVRGFVRKRRLWLSKKLHRRPVSIADLRQRLIDFGSDTRTDALGAVVVE